MGIMPDLRSQLAPLIRAVGVSKVARRSGIHRVTIQRYLAGTADMTGSALERVAHVVGVTLVASASAIAPADTR